MRIASSGNLMIGNTVDDGNRLQVYGDFTFAHPALAHIKSPRYSILMGDEGGGTFMFYGNTTGLPIHIGTANGLNFHKFYFQKSGQTGDDIANYNFTYHTNKGAALNIFSFNEGVSKLLLSAPGNLILGGATDNNNKLQVNGNVWATGMILPTNAAAGKCLPVMPTEMQAGKRLQAAAPDGAWTGIVQEA